MYFLRKNTEKPSQNLCEELGEITVTKPAELSLRRSIQPLVDSGQLRVLEHKGWLTTTEDFIKGAGAKCSVENGQILPLHSQELLDHVGG